MITVSKSYIWSDVILLDSVTLFCDQRQKLESLEKKQNVKAKKLRFLSVFSFLV